MDLQGLTKNNRDSVGLSENCGCLFCKRIFPSQLVKNYISETNEPTTMIHTKPTTEEDDYQEIVRTVTEHLKKEKEKKRLGIDVEDEEESFVVEEEEPMNFDVDGKTAVCPFCLVDSVVSQKDIPELDEGMLSEMSAFYIENYNNDDDDNENEDNEDNENYDDNNNDSNSENEGSDNEDL